MGGTQTGEAELLPIGGAKTITLFTFEAIGTFYQHRLCCKSIGTHENETGYLKIVADCSSQVLCT
jgi:hypothetical protein